MKKISKEFICQMFFGITGIALMVIGALMLIASLFGGDISLFNSIVLMALGAILFEGVTLYFIFYNFLESALKIIEERFKENKGTSPHIHKTNNDIFSNLGKMYNDENPNIRRITIDDNTTTEDLEKYKKEFPPLANYIDDILNLQKDSIKFSNIKNYYSSNTLEDIELSNEELEDKLKLAIEENEFEKAAQIRDELLKRKKK